MTTRNGHSRTCNPFAAFFDRPCDLMRLAMSNIVRMNEEDEEPHPQDVRMGCYTHGKMVSLAVVEDSHDEALVGDVGNF